MATALLLSGAINASAAVTACSDGAKTFLPCELTFDVREGELPKDIDPYLNETMRVEFRSPSHSTRLIRAFPGGNHILRVRFSPTESGTWTYHVTSPIKRYDDQEATFQVTDSGLPGFIAVANVRHWWTTNKQPHLWLSAQAPLLAIDPSAFEGWLDQRKHDGFTHVGGILLSGRGPMMPLTADGRPNEAYFSALDDRLLAIAARGFVLDLIIADTSFVHSIDLADWTKRDPLLRYVIARYGALNVAWQGFEHFEEIDNARTLLNDIAESLDKYDMFRHPRSTGARDTSSSLLRDNWMDYLIESSPHPALGAVEHQFTEKPEIHCVNATAPDDFRHEIWNATTNAEYLSISYEALQNPANAKAVQVLAKVMADTRHWELEPYFDVDGARAVGLNEVEYLAYAETPGIVEVQLPKHKYNPFWVNTITGEEIPLKDYRGEVLSQPTPDKSQDWLLSVPREGHKEMMLRSYRFESEDPPIQEPELDTAKTPFEIAAPSGETLPTSVSAPYSIKLTRANRASRSMQYVWWGEIVAGPDGPRVLGIGPKGTFRMPESFRKPGTILNLRLLAINANGKAYQLDHVYQLRQ
ncbi:MAG TPA: DUF5060 domain-containing protein [Bryobacteraceae bacterium]|nr:DUF5060 domain-containing protein [Bryobacteraceae bacterium]